MQTRGHALSFAVSGQRGTGRTRLYTALQNALPTVPELEKYKFEFIGNPFEERPHPLLWNSTHKKHAVSRLLESWGELNDTAQDRWMPAVLAGKIPIMDSCGLDAVLYATACNGCDVADVLTWQGILIDGRLIEPGLEAPFYILTDAPTTSVVQHLVTNVNSGLGVEEAAAFVEKQRAIISQYFGNTHQKTPLQLPDIIAPEAALARSIMFIRQRVAEHFAPQS